MLGHVLWRKVFPEELLDADKHLNGVCYELLVERRYGLAATLLDFAATTFKRFGSDEYRRMMVVNRAQAYQWLGENDKCQEIMGREDWSASQDSFKLADAVLRDDVAVAVATMRRLGADHDIVGKESYRNWPLFKEIRKDETFRATYREVFGEPLEQVRVTDRDEEEEAGRGRVATGHADSPSPSGEQVH